MTEWLAPQLWCDSTIRMCGRSNTGEPRDARRRYRAARHLLIELEDSTKPFALWCIYQRHIELLIEKCLVINFWADWQRNESPQQSPDRGPKIAHTLEALMMFWF
jgi:hypothetical protein